MGSEKEINLLCMQVVNKLCLSFNVSSLFLPFLNIENTKFSYFRSEPFTFYTQESVLHTPLHVSYSLVQWRGFWSFYRNQCVLSTLCLLLTGFPSSHPGLYFLILDHPGVFVLLSLTGLYILVTNGEDGIVEVLFFTKVKSYLWFSQTRVFGETDRKDNCRSKLTSETGDWWSSIPVGTKKRSGLIDVLWKTVCIVQRKYSSGGVDRWREVKHEVNETTLGGSIEWTLGYYRRSDQRVTGWKRRQEDFRYEIHRRCH